MHILNELIIIFALSIVMFFILNKIKVPSIVVFLLTGVIAGPHGLGVVSDIHNVKILAEIGVILLLFTIGVEFSFSSLFRIKKAVTIGGSLQVGLTFLSTFIICQQFGIPTNQSIFIGFIVSLSSTAIVMKILQEKSEIDTPHGRTTFGILIFQDIIVVPMMLLVPLLAGANGNSTNSIALLILKGVLVFVFVIVSSKWIVPYILYNVIKTKNRELFLLSVIVICFSIAWLTYSIGLSLELGAFLAGLIISESEYHHEALGHILPFKDVFMCLFFVSIGMLLNVVFFAQNPWLIILITIGVIVLKSVVAGLATLLLKLPLRPAIFVGFTLCQVGEFSFILAQVGNSYGLLQETYLQIFVSVSILTMATTPLMIAISPTICKVLIKLPLPSKIKNGLYYKKAKISNKISKHVIIVGFGVNGKNLADFSNKSNIPYTIIEMNPDTVKEEIKKEEPIIHGDATRETLIRYAGVINAKVLAITIPDITATKKITKIARRLNHNIYIVARTRFVDDISQLFELGADEVICDELETSIDISKKVLGQYMIPNKQIQYFVDQIRAHEY